MLKNIVYDNFYFEIKKSIESNDMIRFLTTLRIYKRDFKFMKIEKLIKIYNLIPYPGWKDIFIQKINNKNLETFLKLKGEI